MAGSIGQDKVKSVNFDFFTFSYIHNKSRILERIKELKEEYEEETSKARKKEIYDTIENLRKKKKEDYQGIERFELGKYLKAVENKDILSNIDLGSVVVEIEPNTLRHRGIYSGFQLVNIRDVDLPSKKAVGKPKVDIDLNDDEYIGEFTGILFDESTNVVMVQSNRHGVSIKQVEQYFTGLRRRYLEHQEQGSTQDDILMLVLDPIMDPGQIERAKKKAYHEKLTVKGSKESLLALLGDTIKGDKALHYIPGYLGRMAGVEFEITVKAKRGKNYPPLNKEEVLDVIKDFENIKKGERPFIEVTSRDPDEKSAEVINLLKPRIRSSIRFTLRPRETVGAELLFNKMVEAFSSKQAYIAGLVIRKIV